MYKYLALAEVQTYSTLLKNVEAPAERTFLILLSK